MGSIEARGPSHCANMLKLVLLSLGLAAAQSPDMMREIMQQINKFNMRQACWGETNIIKAQEKCMQLAPTYDLVSVLTPQSNPFTTLPGQITNPFQRISEIQSLDQLTSLWRTKRQATEGILNPDQDDFLEFIEDFGDFKEDIAGKMGNLTCVLTELKYLTEDLKLNIDYYTSPASEIDGFVLEESFAKDPEWSKKLADGYSDCYKISENFPQTALNRNPLTKIFGRHMIFFRCANRNEKRMCAQGQMLKYLEAIYGKDDSKKPSEFGLPDDKYDAAAVSIMVMQNAASSEEEFVGNFFWGEMGM